MNPEYFSMLENTRWVDDGLDEYSEHNDDYNIVATAVKRNGLQLEYASDELKDDKTIVTLAVISDGISLEYASDRLKNDLSIVTFALEEDFRAIFYVGSELLKDEEVFKYLFKIPRVIEYYCSKYSCDRWLLGRFMSINPDSYKFASKDIKSDYSYTKSIIKNHGLVLEHVIPMFKDDDDIVIAAIKNNPSAIQYASDRLKNDHKIVEIALQNGNLAVLKYLHPSFANNKPLILKSIGKLTTTLIYLGRVLRSDLDIIIAAVKMNGNILKELGSSFRENIEIVKAAICSNVEPRYYEVIPTKILEDNRLIEHLFSLRKFIPLGYIPHKLKKIHNLESWIKGHFGNQLPQYDNDYDVRINYL